MSLASTAALVVITAIAVQLVPRYFESRLPIFIDGHVDPKFSAVKSAFRELFEQNWEERGAEFAVYHEGKLVVDLYGGYADNDALRKWKQDTLTLALSMTKAVSALCLAILVDRNQLDYNKLVSDYWPKFSQNGKENITVAMVLNHQAGLAWLDADNMTWADAFNQKLMADLIEQQKPHWPAGTGAGYHAITFGWIVDELMLRTDGRTMSQFVKEELMDKYDLEFYIGLPAEIDYRMSRAELESLQGVIGQAMSDYSVVRFIYNTLSQGPNSRLSNVFKNVPWLFTHGRWPFNHPDLHMERNSAVGGITNARSMAKLMALVADGKILNSTTIDKIREPVIIELEDLVMGEFDAPRGHGFMYTKYKKDWMMGHSGFGGSYTKVHLNSQLSFSYLSNSFKTATGDAVRSWNKLQSALLSCV